MDHRNAILNEKLQFLTEKGLEQFVGDESVKVEKILCGNVAAVSGHNVGSEGIVGTDEVNQRSQGRTRSVCPGLNPSAISRRILQDCLCLWHVVPKLPCVTLGCTGQSTAEIDLSDIIDPLQSYLLSSSAEHNIFYWCTVNFIT